MREDVEVTASVLLIIVVGLLSISIWTHNIVGSVCGFFGVLGTIMNFVDY